MTIHFLLDLSRVTDFTTDALDDVVRTQLGIPTAATRLDFRFPPQADIHPSFIEALLGAYRRTHCIPERITHTNNEVIHAFLLGYVTEHAWGTEVVDQAHARTFTLEGTRPRPATYA